MEKFPRLPQEIEQIPSDIEVRKMAEVYDRTNQTIITERLAEKRAALERVIELKDAKGSDPIALFNREKDLRADIEVMEGDLLKLDTGMKDRDIEIEEDLARRKSLLN